MSNLSDSAERFLEVHAGMRRNTSAILYEDHTTLIDEPSPDYNDLGPWDLEDDFGDQA